MYNGELNSTYNSIKEYKMLRNQFGENARVYMRHTLKAFLSETTGQEHR